MNFRYIDEQHNSNIHNTQTEDIKMVEITLCDKCHNKIEAHWWDGLPNKERVNFNTYDLCRKCSKEFEKFMGL